MERARAKLLAWYDTHQRNLPWRQDTDPYRVWVSEVMLQQTRVETVTPRYIAWMQQFPTLGALASADEDEVLAAWSGLGYYRRARFLHAAARHIQAEGWPRDAAQLSTLPGIGPYASAAIASIAFNEPIAAVDGNVNRVMSRLEGIELRVDQPPGRRAIARAATRWLATGRPGDWNQAVMELGARVCTPAMPNCGACPLQRACWAFEHARTDLPNTTPKAKPIPSHPHFARVYDGDRVLLVREPGHGLLGGLWRLPGGTEDADNLAEQVREQTGYTMRVGPGAPRRVRHMFTHRIWNMAIHDGTVTAGPGAPPRQGADAAPAPAGALPAKWCTAAELDDVGLSTAMRKAIEA